MGKKNYKKAEVSIESGLEKETIGDQSPAVPEPKAEPIASESEQPNEVKKEHDAIAIAAHSKFSKFKK